MSNTTEIQNNINSENQQLLFGVDTNAFQKDEPEWYQGNLDIIIPVMIIFAGLFQFVLRKWILPVSDDVISKLENQFPSQGLLYMPVFGLLLIFVGIVLLVVFNIG